MATISYDPGGAFLEHQEIRPNELVELWPRLVAARAEVLADARLWADGGDVPPEKRPLDAGFHELPERLLSEFREKDSGSVQDVSRLGTR